MQLCPYTKCGIDIKQFKKTNKKGKYGGFGAVFEVEDLKTNKLYAAKIMTTNYTEESINHEIGILMFANHPTIIKFIGFSFKDFSNDDRVTIIMELAENGSLSDVLEKVRSNQIPEDYNNTTRQIILIGITRGMKYLHDRKIIHRDLKPGNILINKDFHPLISDFGMSKFFKPDESNDQSKWGGSYSYMAPEIINGLNYNQKADVYSFGIIMFEVVTGLVPYPDFKNGKIKSFHLQNKICLEDYRPQFESEIKESFKELVERCWSKEPDDRPTFSELFKMLSNKDDEFDSKYFFDGVDVEKINQYFESITKIDDAIEELNHRIETIEKQNKQLKNDIEQLKNKNFNENHQLTNDKNFLNIDDKKNKEEMINFKSAYKINYQLSLSNLTAEIIESPEVKGDLFIPTFVNFNSKQFKVTRICNDAFKNTEIESISFSYDSEVKVIDNHAFENSTIKKLFIPRSLTKLNKNWIFQTNELSEIEVDENNLYFLNESGFLFYSKQGIKEKEKSFEIIFAPKNFEGDFLVPEKVTCIGRSAFQQRQGLLSLTSKSPSFEKIKSYCFYKCKNLKSIFFEGQMDLFFGGFCFHKSKNLFQIKIACKKIQIGRYCFSDCKSLCHVILNATGEIKLSLQAFRRCSNLENIALHNASLIKIGDECFIDSDNLKSVAFCANSVIFGKNITKNCPLLSYIAIESENCIEISSNTLGCANLKFIKLKTSSALKLNDFCFKKLTKLNTIEFFCDIFDVGKKCFSKCFLLTVISLQVISDIKISNEFFLGCKSLKKLILSSKSKIFICDKFMNEANKLETVEISGKQVNIDQNCFNNCQSLSKFLITNSGQIELKENQFIECNNLEIISIQCSIINIYKDQICNFKALKHINIESDSNISLKTGCFIGFNNLEDVSLSGVKISIKDDCFKNCSNLKKININKVENLVLFSNVFQNCTKLIEIDFKVDTELVCKKDCFYGSNIKIAKFQGKSVKLKRSCFENHLLCKSVIESVNIICENVIIDDKCFNGCSSLKTLSISSENEPKIGFNVFDGCINYHQPQ